MDGAIDSGLDALDARVSKLERQTRRLGIFFITGVIVALTFACASNSMAAQNSVTFRDASGSVRLSADGLYLYDAKGAQRLGIDMSYGEPIIRLQDSAKRGRVFVGITTDGVPRVEFTDSTNTQRMYAGLTTAQTGLLRTFTASGKDQTSLEDTFLRIQDASGVEQVAAGVSTQNAPVLHMYDASHSERIFAGIYNDGSAGLSAYGSDGTRTWRSP